MKKSESRGDRRGFLKKSAAGLGAMVVFPAMGGQEDEPAAPKKSEDYPIVTRPFGKTGLTLPVISMGTGACENPEVVRAALDAGVMLLDTAHSYGNGANETMIGEVIKDRPRESYVIQTKVEGGPKNRRTGVFTGEAKAGPFIEKFEESLKRLGIDYVDILCLHGVVNREAVLWDEYVGALQKMKDEGKTRFAGVSTHSGEPEVLRTAAEDNVYDVVVTAYNFRQPHQKEMSAALAEAAKAGIGIVAMKTQAGVYWDGERQKQINPTAAIKWVLQNENVHTTIPGFNTFDQLQTDLSVMEDLKLTPGERKALEQGEDMGLFCPQCDDCLAQCPRGVDVPALMRSYMYAYGYRNLASAKAALDSAALPGTPCDDCASCSVSCRMGFDVKSKIQDVARLRSLPWEFVA